MDEILCGLVGAVLSAWADRHHKDWSYKRAFWSGCGAAFLIGALVAAAAGKIELWKMVVAILAYAVFVGALFSLMKWAYRRYCPDE